MGMTKSEKEEVVRVLKEDLKNASVREEVIEKIAEETTAALKKFKEEELTEIKKIEEREGLNKEKVLKYVRKILENKREIKGYETAIDFMEFKNHLISGEEMEEERATRKKLIEGYKKRINELKKQNEEIGETDIEGYVAKNLLYLRDLKKGFLKGLASLPSIEEKKEEIKELLKKGRIPFLYGETGTGKTTLAKAIAKEITGENPEILAGNEKTTYEEIMGFIGLVAEDLKVKDVFKLIKKEQEEFLNAYKELEENKDEYKRGMRLIEAKAKALVERKSPETKYIQSRILEALKKGRIVIIDEANRIPPGLLSVFHYLFDAIRNKGEIVTPSGEKIDLKNIKNFPGFILTGNYNIETKNRYHVYELDPAFKDRVEMIEHSTSDQEIDPSKEYKSKDTKRDLYMLGILQLMDKQSKIKAPPNVFENTWRLAQAFKAFQNAFAGKQPLKIKGKGGVTIDMNLYQNNASLRTFLDILEDWKKDGYEYKIDHYVFKKLIERAKTDAIEAGTFYTVLKDIYGFFPSGDGWPEFTMEEGMKIFPIEDIKVKNPEKGIYFSYREIIENVLAKETPKASKEMKEMPLSQETVEAIYASENFLLKKTKNLKKFEKIIL